MVKVFDRVEFAQPLTFTSVLAPGTGQFSSQVSWL